MMSHSDALGIVAYHCFAEIGVTQLAARYLRADPMLRFVCGNIEVHDVQTNPQRIAQVLTEARVAVGFRTPQMKIAMYRKYGKTLSQQNP